MSSAGISKVSLLGNDSGLCYLKDSVSVENFPSRESDETISRNNLSGFETSLLILTNVFVILFIIFILIWFI
ncbi:hypothetical protein CVS40_12737 [Lucilia cuprina]|nr:hypothetical protein CVS40_12737 [Lucilia cuprina]